jgi:hypothetical protein
LPGFVLESHTNCHWLDANALLNVSIGSVIRILALQNLLPAKRVDKSCASCRELIR